MDIITILNFPVPEYGIPFYLFVLSLVSFISVIVFRSFTSLVKFIPRCFLLFDVIINEIVFLISVSDNLLVYRNTTYFCILIFVFCSFTASETSQFIISNSF